MQVPAYKKRVMKFLLFDSPQPKSLSLCLFPIELAIQDISGRAIRLNRLPSVCISYVVLGAVVCRGIDIAIKARAELLIDHPIWSITD